MFLLMLFHAFQVDEDHRIMRKVGHLYFQIDVIDCEM